MQQAVNAVAQHRLIGASKLLGIAHQTLQNRLRLAERHGIKADKSGLDAQQLSDQDRLHLQDRLRDLEATLKSERRERLSEDRIRDEIFGLAKTTIAPPAWATEAMRKADRPGIPSVLWSDWHWGEVVLPGQIHGKNEFNVAIAKKRLQRLVSRTIGLCFSHMTNPDYPGIVVNLGGDLVSGDIHDELVETNELTSAQTLIDIVGALSWALETLADRFGRVWVVAVAGNHGRMTKKPRAKNRAFTNFDWVIAQLLNRHFSKDKRFSWLIPDGPDAWYRVYSHRYLLTHGDQFRGGDGIIGALGPILRGDTKKRARNSNLELGYDTMLLGHWHQYLSLRRVIVNGALKGYDEYAAQNNFAFEPPIQALWFTHQRYGLTAAWPIYCEDPATQFRGEAVQLGEMPRAA
jgi:hypothetical protein